MPATIDKPVKPPKKKKKRVPLLDLNKTPLDDQNSEKVAKKDYITKRNKANNQWRAWYRRFTNEKKRQRSEHTMKVRKIKEAKLTPEEDEERKLKIRLRGKRFREKKSNVLTTHEITNTPIAELGGLKRQRSFDLNQPAKEDEHDSEIIKKQKNDVRNGNNVQHQIPPQSAAEKTNAPTDNSNCQLYHHKRCPHWKGFDTKQRRTAQYHMRKFRVGPAVFREKWKKNYHDLTSEQKRIRIDKNTETRKNRIKTLSVEKQIHRKRVARIRTQRSREKKRQKQLTKLTDKDNNDTV